MSIAPPSDFEIAPVRLSWIPFASALACVAFADWLFYDQWLFGISVPLFLAMLGIVAVACNGVRAGRQTRILMTGVFILGLVALVEEVSTLSTILGLLGTALFVITVTTAETASRPRQLFEAVTIPFRGPFRLMADSFQATRRLTNWTPNWVGWLAAWIVPILLFAIFVALFASANPLIESQLKLIDFRAIFYSLFTWRFCCWVFFASMIWPLLHRGLKTKLDRQAQPNDQAKPDTPGEVDYLFGTQAILRSLVLFNALFALQSGLDLAYLWGGLNLPDGMSHAEYAHRGAYPLIATALLAAGFALVAMRPGGPAEQSRWIKPLVLLWTAQNVLLVISSIFRLDLYVEAYSLTYLRVAAFFWMALVAVGLVLMIVQIARKKPTSWLIAANTISLVIVLYACCFINMPWLIASYNVSHSHDMGGNGPELDISYAMSLGPQAKPALMSYLQKHPTCSSSYAVECFRLRNEKQQLGNWRDWSFRAWRLERYLSNNPRVQPNPDDTGKG